MATGEFLPALAESWNRPDPMTIEFKLRKGVRFHNGADFSADDVVDTLNTVINPEYGIRNSISVDWPNEVEKVGGCSYRLSRIEAHHRAVPWFRRRIVRVGSFIVAIFPLTTAAVAATISGNRTVVNVLNIDNNL